MLARIGQPFDSDDHRFEIKWDGVRALTFIEGDGYRMHGRRRRDLVDRYPELAFLGGLPAGTVLDGELVVLGDDGCPDFPAMRLIARQHGLALIEDAAQSFGATQDGMRSGSLGTIGATSFFPAKPLGAYGDAGACFTNDANLMTRLRELRDHGQSRRYHHVRLGINARMASIQAAVLLQKLTVFDDELVMRQRAAQCY